MYVSSYIRHNPGMTVVDLYGQYITDLSYFGEASGDLLIIQCGICDCAPRPIPLSLRKTISSLPAILRNIIVKFLHRFRSKLLRLGLSWQVVDPERFREIYQAFVQKAVKEVPYVCVINIAPTTPQTEKQSPGLSSSIELYNKIIMDIVVAMSANNLFLLDVHSEILSQENALEKVINKKDGHHLTKEGHLFYADLFFRKVFPKLK